MRRFLLRRLLALVPVLLGVTLLSFLLLYVVPGDPVQAVAGERYDDAVLDALRAELHLDDPLPLRYGRFLLDLARGDLGVSYVTREPVRDAIFATFPHTLRLALSAMLVAVVLGVGLGLAAALKPGSLLDRAAMVFASLGISVPVFWLGMVLILAFSIRLRWLPPSGYGGGDLAHLVMPSLTLGLASAALVARMTRASLLEVMGQDYIRTARAKGLKPSRILLVHGLRNALLPVVTVVGNDFGSYLSGSVLTERIFAWPGLGRYTLDAVAKRDLPAIQGAILVMALAFVLVNLLVDLSYAWIDPRTRREAP
ncbi:MAG: ABC transporter permease [Candidatus Krumholzibacteriia bacterium]|nr:ABC transporter permease [Candidatus Latescibacterota bacterium]MCB9514752.1 ABC transporter permease [Candidatus Latescibacterota bacterium]